jgi:translation elongation factor aEF-1 beta
MGTVSVKMKVLPESPDVDFEGLKEKIKSIVEKYETENCHFEEEPIAFGLKALITIFDCPDNLDVEPIEQELGKVENVNSVQLTDMRRAIG